LNVRGFVRVFILFGKFVAAFIALFAHTVCTAQAVQTSPHRIVTLAPHLAQLADAAGVSRFTVGVSEYTPTAYAKTLPVIGNAFAINWQAIAELKPTLVMVWGSGTPLAVKTKLKALGLATFESEPSTLADIVKEAQQLATRLGEPSDNASLVQLQAQFAQLGAYPSAAALSKPLAVFHPIWPRPLMTVNGKHVISDAMRYCGARNVFAATRGLTPTVTLPQVLREKPAAIIIAHSQNEAQLSEQWSPLFKAFPASHAPALIKVNGDRFHQPGPGLMGETLELCQALKALR
jgi:iron complex transport system substrate-binding protein